MRRHGWQHPLDPHQVSSIVLFAGLVSGYYAFFTPFVENRVARHSAGVIYAVTVAFVVALNIITSWTDPSDPGLNSDCGGDYFCNICQASVQEGSKHCRSCERCVEGFDHHCKWLNNCIGRKNYKTFFGLVSMTVSMLAVQFGLGVYLFVSTFAKAGIMKTLVHKNYGKSVNYVGFQCALAAYVFIVGASVFMLGELLVFHIVLLIKGMTTYEFILAQRDKANEHEDSQKQHNICCRQARVHDESSQPSKHTKIGINPCTAIKTHIPVTRSKSSLLASKPLITAGEQSDEIIGCIPSASAHASGSSITSTDCESPREDEQGSPHLTKDVELAESSFANLTRHRAPPPPASPDGTSQAAVSGRSSRCHSGC